ncbi:YqgU-like beta propeller domain-containing protein [Robertmurraya andreesenii]|uniref:YqgU-like 6-bladed beta-propeller domain-containing protein n=1 Tax=Anoxybacillus andreesenii TaxID=1325932 RepID=A0ABT9V628_9BACL|nr:hypothetical protein [Robertmurraya andreesenii]MDQ0156394.1 hypothetical protein [Robertmurraya andreesenii]
MSKQSLHKKRLNLFVFLVLLYLLSGCIKENDAAPLPSLKEPTSPSKGDQVGEEKSIVPIEIKNGSFSMVAGWLDDNTIVYVTDSNEGSTVYSYGLQDGEKRELFHSDFPIADILISPSRKHLLIHSAPSSNEAKLVIITNTGEEIYSEIIPSTELSLKWSPFDEGNILLTAFTEDWNFSIWNLDIKSGKKAELSLPQPFGTWLDREKLLYLDWDLENPSLTTRTKQFDLRSEESHDILEGIYLVDSFRDAVITVAPDNEHDQDAVYTFYTHELEETYSFRAPRLTRYSDWLVPYYTYLEGQQRFLSFQPLYSTEADVYSEGFQLISIDLDTGDEEVLLEGLENEPLSCSPDGKRCLSGFYLEKLIDLESKKIQTLVEME